jgi:hypothetical protein
MLPTGFEWEDYIDGQRLRLNGQIIAMWTELSNGGARICKHPSRPLILSYVFTASPEEAVQHLQAWATRWESRLREMY